MSKINTIVFDFDGTIADTNQIILDSWQAVYRAYTGENGPEDYIISTFGEPLYASMKAAFPNHDVEETVTIYREFQKTIFRDEIKAFPGMAELIKELKAEGYKLGIATARLRESTLVGIDAMGIGEYIDALVTVEDTEKHKPDPEPVLICMEKMGSTAEETLMVGDSDFDMGSGNQAGVITVMVGWSQAAKSADSVAKTKLDLQDQDPAGKDIFKPDYIIEKAEYLWGILRRI